MIWYGVEACFGLRSDIDGRVTKPVLSMKLLNSMRGKATALVVKEICFKVRLTILKNLSDLP